MAWILTRKKADCFQIYSSENIYGRGKWLGKDEGGLLDLPVAFKYQEWAVARMRSEYEKDPDWIYEVRFYDR